MLLWLWLGDGGSKDERRQFKSMRIAYINVKVRKKQSIGAALFLYIDFLEKLGFYICS